MYEQRPKLGGMLRYGIPDYRLPQEMLDADIDVASCPPASRCIPTYPSASDIPFDELQKQYDAVYISHRRAYG